MTTSALFQDCNLINEDCTPMKSKEEMSSAERSARHGELKQLRKLKRAHENENSRKPKILKADSAMEVEFQDVEEEDTSMDVRDIEFRLKNDPLQVQVRHRTYKENDSSRFKRSMF